MNDFLVAVRFTNGSTGLYRVDECPSHAEAQPRCKDGLAFVKVALASQIDKPLAVGLTAVN